MEEKSKKAKNIIVIDCDELGLYKQFIDSSEFNLIACIVYYEKDKNYCLEFGVEYVLTLEEADFLQQMENFSFSLINNYRDTQRKVEFGMMRSLNSNMLIANKYYNALCYFEHIFNTHRIDCVFVNGIPHGYIPETILLDMATKRGIPAYCSFPIAPDYSSILRFDTKQHIPVSSPIDSTKIVAHLFYTNKDWCSDDVIANILNQEKIRIWIHRWGGGNRTRCNLVFKTFQNNNPYGVLQKYAAC